MRIMGHDLHAECSRAGSDFSSNGAEADQPEALAGRLPAHQFRTRPFAGDHGRRCCKGATQQQQHRRDHVFHHRGVIGAGRRIDRDLARGAGRNVDIVEPDAQTADRFELAGPRQQIGVHPGAIAHDQGARIGKRGEKFIAAIDQRGVIEHVVSGQDVLDGILVHELRDDDRGHQRRKIRRCGRAW